MSVDPLAAGAADLAALVDAELSALAADAAALRNLLVEGTVVTARVLPSNGLTDLIEIAGLRVAASLPPTVRPGDVLSVQVKGFDGDRVLVQIVDTPPQEAPPPLAPAPAPTGAYFTPSSVQLPPLPSVPAPAPPPAASAPTVAPAPAGIAPSPQSTNAAPTQNAAPQPPSAPQASSAPQAPAPSVPPRVVVTVPPPLSPTVSQTVPPRVSPSSVPPPAAQVPEPAPTPGGVTIPPILARPSMGAAYSAAPLRTSPPPPQPGAAGATPAPPTSEPTSIEARLAAARTAIANVAARIAGATRGAEPAVPGAPKAPPQSSVSVPPPAAAPRFVPPPSVAAKPATVSGAVQTAVQSRPQVVAPPQPEAAPRATGLSAYTQPVALLRALRLAVTPSNVAAATTALENPERLPAALNVLERALPHVSDDPNVATLRTLLSFVGRIDPKSPVLAAQIAAYVDHVVDGSEPKIATFLAAAQATDLTPAPPPETSPQAVATPASSAPPAPGTPQQQNASSPAPSSTQTAPPAAHAPPPVAAAIAVERGAALNMDLKQTIMTIAADPQTAPALAPALSNALSALTAVQVGASQLLQAQPGGVAFTVPLSTEFGQRSAHITVQREAPDGSGAKLDTSNFRIAFILETAHYGTVAIDLVTVGREVTVDVRAETGTAMRAFRDALGQLKARLESLNYTVASAAATVGSPTTISVEAPAPASAPRPDAVVDRQA